MSYTKPITEKWCTVSGIIQKRTLSKSVLYHELYVVKHEELQYITVNYSILYILKNEDIQYNIVSYIKLIKKWSTLSGSIQK